MRQGEITCNFLLFGLVTNLGNLRLSPQGFAVGTFSGTRLGMSFLAFNTARSVLTLMALLGLSICVDTSPPLRGHGPTAAGGMKQDMEQQCAAATGLQKNALSLSLSDKTS